MLPRAATAWPDKHVNSKTSIITDRDAALRQAREILATDPEAAVRQARELLRTDPENPRLLRLAAAGLRRISQVSEAEQLEQRAIQASTRSPEHREAARAIAAGDKIKAARILEGLITRDETDVVALVMLGLQLSTDGELEMAEQLLRKAVGSAPSDPSARLALVEHLHRAKRPTEALETLDEMGSDPDSVAARSLRANILRDLGRQDEEIAILEQLAASEPRPEAYRVRLGHALRTLGRTAEAIAAYRAVLAQAPFDGTSWWSLANLKTMRFTDDDIAAMERGLTLPQAPATNRIRLHFALGKALADRQETERAFRHYAAGNRLKNSTSNYKPEKIRRWVDQAESNYDAGFFRGGESGCRTPDPIFIIGMQRSGSTLVEQILDSHPMVEGTAELTELPAIVRKQGEMAHRGGRTFSEHLRSLDNDELRALGEEYIDRTRVYRRTGKPFFTDKMPANWLYVGVIRLILPNAKIVDVRRHPLACCFANWKQLYGSGLEHTYSMEHMGRYYGDYIRLMRHLDEVQPGKIHRLLYDRLVEDIEGEVRGLLQYLDLPFDKSCLNFYSSQRSVRTISAEQVRRPINREGLNQWQPYEQWLGPLKEALGPVLEDWQR